MSGGCRLTHGRVEKENTLKELLRGKGREKERGLERERERERERDRESERETETERQRGRQGYCGQILARLLRLRLLLLLRLLA